MHPVHLPLKDLTPPAAGHVDLWLSRLGSLPLTTPEGDALQSRKIRRLQQQFLLRLLLGAYLGRPGRDVQVVKCARGKPGLAPELATTGLNFSLSHSGDWLLIAVARDAAVGVDLERAQDRKKALEMARRYFSQREYRYIEQLETPARSRAFLRLWTAKEAMVKAAGTGLAGYLDQVEVDLDGPPRLVGVPDDWPSPAQWSLLEPDLPDGLLGHLAAMAADAEYSLYCLERGTQ